MLAFTTISEANIDNWLSNLPETKIKLSLVDERLSESDGKLADTQFHIFGLHYGFIM